jgi:hypothetical protein
MSRLRDLQSAMCEMALDRRLPATLADRLRDDRPIPATERLRIHRNNTLLGLINPLAGSFPVVAKLVGEEFFERMALDFIRAHPPTRPELLAYGQELPGFIATYAAAAAVPYLSDMARLELAYNVAYNAVDREPLVPAVLQRFSPAQLETLRLAPHPSLRFVASDFPLLAIWQAHQADGDLDRPIDLAQGGDMLLVYRPRAETLIRSVSAGCFAFVMALAAGQSLDGAYHSALSGEPRFSLTNELASLLAAEIFVEAIPS